MERKLKVGLVGLCQVNFLGDKTAAFDRANKGLAALCQKFGADYAFYPELPVTRNDSEKAAKWAKSEGVELLLIHLSSFAAGETILELCDAAPFLGLWATPEPAAEGTLLLNSYCGVNMFGSILTHYKPTRHKYFLNWADTDEFAERFAVTVRAVSALVRLRDARVALVGGIAPGFNDLYFDERDWQDRLGCEIHRSIEFSDVADRADKLSDAAVKKYADMCSGGYASIDPEVEKNMGYHARLFGGYYELALENGYEAMGVSCWPRPQNYHNMLDCSTIGKLNEYGIPSACEGDLPAAISMLAMKYMFGGVTTLLDLVSHDCADNSVQLWHCGPTAVCLANKKGAAKSRFYEMDGKVCQRRCAMNDMIIAPGPGSVFRITGECDSAFVLSGKMSDREKPSFYGSRGWFGELRLADEAIGSNDLIHTIQSVGFQHHYPYAPADITDAIMEFCAWLDLDVIQKVPYKPYLV